MCFVGCTLCDGVYLSVTLLRWLSVPLSTKSLLVIISGMTNCNQKLYDATQYNII